MAKQHKHDFDKLRHVATKYYRETNCCTVIAVAVAARVGFGKAYHAMKREGRRDRQGAYLVQYKRALDKFGFDIVPIENNLGKTLAAAKKRAPKKGTFLVNTRGHVTCIRDGEMVDWAADNNSRKRILWVHQVIKRED